MAGLAAAIGAASPPPPPLHVTAEAGQLRVFAGGQTLTSPDLVGALLVVAVADAAGRPAGTAEVRIDAVKSAAENPAIVLHTLTVAESDGRQSYCAADARGRNAAYAMRGRIDASGRFFAVPDALFLACTSGAVGKCVLWGYDPWQRTADGRSFAPFYEACIRMARADYLGDGVPHTREGTVIDVADTLGVRRWQSRHDRRFGFEAGWAPAAPSASPAPAGPTLPTLPALRRAHPALAGRCDPATAASRGALIFTRVSRAPKAAARQLRQRGRASTRRLTGTDRISGAIPASCAACGRVPAAARGSPAARRRRHRASA